MSSDYQLDTELIKKNIEKVKEDIQKYSPYPEKVKLVVVTKYFDYNGVERVLEAGHNIVGENKGQVIRDKESYFNEKFRNFPNEKKDIQWHFIGNLQKNKIKYIVKFVDLIHSINRLSVAQELDKKAQEIGRVIDILLEINIAGEESKEGYKLEELMLEIPEYLKLKNLKVIGLMTMAQNTENEEVLKNTFSKLRETKEILNERYFNNSLTELSMGMSGDYKVALAEGATIIRVGTKIFEKEN
ncbi:MAG: YggS family pyridoxal phosphate-dependent enzyme [Fusobacteriaceae bacterium]